MFFWLIGRVCEESGLLIQRKYELPDQISIDGFQRKILSTVKGFQAAGSPFDLLYGSL